MRFVETEMVYRDQQGATVLHVKSTLIQTSGALKP
jgi:hypothetical protein